MKPIGPTFKQEGWDKWGRLRKGEIMVVHQCIKCNKVSINRIAGDDKPGTILAVFRNSMTIGRKIPEELKQAGIKLATENNREEIKTQLFGKKVLNNKEKIAFHGFDKKHPKYLNYKQISLFYGSFGFFRTFVQAAGVQG